jgi:enoyl-[acyl-carrier protein] reductase / trans-2-enoyl-CoA reductase (NAD+)
MAQTVVSPRIRGFICTTAHPVGCAKNVADQIAVATASRPSELPETYRVLVLGASTGYGLAGRIAATYLYGARTLGVFFEKPGEGAKTGSPGWYNTAAFDAQARADGFDPLHINGDAFSDAIKEQVIARIRETMGQVDAVIYSLAAPRRTDPETGEVYSSVLKPLGEPYTGKTIDLNKEEVVSVTIDPATDAEVQGTVNVMGGDDLRRWTDALLVGGVLAPGAVVVPLSYIGPEVTYAIYRSGTIGRAKEHLEATTRELDARLQAAVGGRALVSVNKAVVTQASAAIPVVPLYYSVLTRLLKASGQHEEPIHQMVRLFTDHIGPGRTPTLDAESRIRLDDRELAPEVQAEVARLWPTLSTENLHEITDYAGYKRGFRQLFGFEVDGVDYEAPVETELNVPI